MQQRIEYIDIAKGIGILLVYIGHCEIGEGNISGLISWIYSFHMPLFFVISGLLFSTKHVPATTFYRNKFASLIVPYIIFSIINYVLLKLSPVGATLGFITQGWGRNPLWFIPILFLVNVSQYHLMWGKWWERIPILLVLVSLLVWKVHTNGWLPYSASELPWFCICFISGYWMKNLIKNAESWKYQWIYGVIGLVVLTIILFSVVLPYDTNYLHMDNNVICWTMKYGLGLLGSVSVIFLSMSLNSIKWTTNIFSWVGINSLVILCTHKLFYIILQTINYQPFVRGGYNHLIVWGLMMGVIILYNKYCNPLIKKLHS